MMEPDEAIENFETDDIVEAPQPPRKSPARRGRSHPLYLRKSIRRLSVIADRPLKSKSDVCDALIEYGYCLPIEQREILEKWCE